MYILGVDMYI